MLILLNIIILLFLLGMVALWATYGFFSAFLQLLIVVAAGVIAMALWEPLTFWLLGRMPAYAWGVGLLAPFALSLIILRGFIDKFCKMNLHFPRMADQAGGAVCGLAAGVLAIGLFLNGVSLLPMAPGVLGWSPYVMQNNDVTANEDGQLWSFTRVNEWSAKFYGMLSTGSMSSSTPQAVFRPDLPKRAALFRLQDDPNQMKTAQPANVQVDGLYTVEASAAGVRELVYRGIIMAFLSPSYELPESARTLGGAALRDVILDEYQARADGDAEGRPSEMLNLEVITATTRAMEYPQTNPATNREDLNEFLDAVAERLAADLAEKLEGQFGEGRQFLLVDTRWNNEKPGAYNPDDRKLRLAFPQVRLQVTDGSGYELLPPIGYSVEESQFSRARTFTEVVSSQHYIAYSDYPDFHMGLLFVVDGQSQKPVHLFVRELRFDLNKLPTPEGADSKIIDDFDAVALAWGYPPLPRPEDEPGEGQDNNNTGTVVTGVQVGATGVYAEMTERMPRRFGAPSASSIESDKSTEPWTLKQGAQDNIDPRSGGARNSLSSVWAQDGDRLIRLEMDSGGANSLFGQARAAAASLGVMTLSDDGGNKYDAIGFILVKSDGKLHIDIRTGTADGGLHASELPRPGPGDQLFIYFQVPENKNIIAYYLSGAAQDFEEPIRTTPK